MVHVVFAIISGAYLAGIFTLATVLMIYLHNRQKVLLYLAFFLGALTAQQLYLTYLEYNFVNLSFRANYIFTEINYIFLSFIFFTLPLLCHEMTETPHRRGRNIFFACLAGSMVVLGEISRIFILPTYRLAPQDTLPPIQPTLTIVYGIKLFVFFYVLTLLSWRYRSLKLKAERVFAGSSILFLILWAASEFRPFIRSYPVSLIPGSMLFVVWNIFLIRFTIRYYTSGSHGGSLRQEIDLPEGGASFPMISARTAESMADEKSEIQLDDLMTRYNISGRELEVIQLIMQGESNKGIANKLFISEATVKTHIVNIFRKTGIKSRMELLVLIKNG